MVVLGIDEVGRGSLAGPLVVGAVVLDRKIPGIKDSKLLSRTQRERYYDEIIARAKFTGLGWVSVEEVDGFGLSRALRLGAARALNGFDLCVDRIVLDGNYDYLSEICTAETIVMADLIIPAVSAASIIAKVARDKYMIDLANKFPLYSFDKHVGYGTAIHIDALRRYGACIHHRRSFEPLKSILSIETVKSP